MVLKILLCKENTLVSSLKGSRTVYPEDVGALLSKCILLFVFFVIIMYLIFLFHFKQFLSTMSLSVVIRVQAAEVSLNSL